MLSAHPHRRFNPLNGEWVLVSPHRTQRPWQGQLEKTDLQIAPAYDPDCYLCAGNERVGGHRNPDYATTFVFDNDFPALYLNVPEMDRNDHDLLIAKSERGVSKVVCFSPNHSLTLAKMKPAEIRPVVDTWVEQYKEIGAMPEINLVQIFENRGSMMGASNPHPHCQIWATESLSVETLKEDWRQTNYRDKNGTCLLCDYAAIELKEQERIVSQNDYFLVVVPFWAVWPFEVMLLSKRHLSAMDELTDAERDGLAEILNDITARYDRVFEAPFPYTMGFHQRPTDDQQYPHWHFHAHYYPPLLRSATVRKFMVGFEMLGNPQRDITAESAAERLRACGR